MSKPQQPAQTMPQNWQAVIGQLKELLAESKAGVLVVVIDQSTIVVDNSINHTTIHQHGHHNRNYAFSPTNLNTLDEYN